MRSKPLSILELNFERGWRGGERQTLYSMRGFQDAGEEVSLVCRKGCPMAAKALAAGFKVHAFPNVFGVLFYLLRYGRNYDIIHAQTSHILTYCVLAKPFYKAKLMFTRRVDFVPHGRFTRLKYKLTDKVIAISTAIKRILEEFGVSDVNVISSAIVKKELNVQRAKSLLAPLQIAPGTQVLGTTAALVGHKDPLTMVEAIGLLAAKRNDFIFLHFGKGDLEPQMLERIKELGIEQQYKLMGFHEEVEDIFSVLDLFVMSSEQEGLGSSVLDAFLYKVPVVATDAGGLTDLLEEGRGVMCPRKSPEALAEGINNLLDQPLIRQANVSRAYTFAKEQHDLQYLTDKYLETMYSLQGDTYHAANAEAIL